MRLLAFWFLGWVVGIAVFWAWAYWDIFLKDKE